jgi:flagellar hook protein FlgE
MASFSIPLTGLNADSVALNTIANNLSNMSTTAFKAQTTSFASLFSQEIGSTGSGDAIQQGAGVQVAANQTDFTQGSTSSVDCTAADVAINGNGFFVLNDGNGGYEYTRAGNFTTDSSGNLQTLSGLSVMGYPAVDGVVNTNASLTPINIPMDAVQPGNATSNISITANVNPDYGTSGTPFSYEMNVYDSQGTPHQATFTFTQTGTNTWSYSVALPATDFTSGTSTPVTGTLTFDQNGVLSDITPTSGTETPVGTTSSGGTPSINLGFTGLADGAKDLNMSWNLLNSSGTPAITQMDTSSASAVSASPQDGYTSGQYSSFTIGSDGTVTVTFSNGEKENTGQLALANVTNDQGLKSVGAGNYVTTLASGTAVVSTAGSAGLGQIEDATLEGSNVNISSEFSQLIIAQRAFEADSKAVTTFDTVTQDTINMIHG